MITWIIFGYVLPAVVFFVLNCWDEILCTNKLTLGDILAILVISLIPIWNILCVIGISDHFIKKYDLINWDFVIYRRK